MRRTRILVLALLLAANAGVPAQETPPPAPHKPSEDTEAAQRAEMRREVEEAARAIEAYSVARRDDAARRAQQAMADIDRHLRRFQAEWSAEAKRVGERSEDNRRKALAEARARRDQLDRQYRAMQESNAQAWERARAGFIRAYRDLAAALGMRPAEQETADQAESQQKETKPNEPKAP